MDNSTPPYMELRQIIQDAVDPIKEQLNRIYDSLNKEFYRKDALDPQLEAMKSEIKELKSAVMGSTQKNILYIASILGAILSFVTLLHFFHIL